MEFAPGLWEAEVVASAFGRTGTGKEQIAVTFRADDGVEGTWYGYFTDRALPVTLAALAALGWDGAAHGHDLSVLHGDGSPILGARALLDVRQEEYDGRTRVKIAFVNALGAGGGALRDRMTPDEAVAFARTLRARLVAQAPAAAGPAAAPRKKKPRAARVAQADFDADIPF